MILLKGILMIKKFFYAIFVSIFIIGQSSITHAIDLRQDQIDTINSVSAYLKSFKTMESDFLQVAPDGSTSNGKLWIRRPGLMRFEYAPPEKLLIIADGLWLGVIDRKIKQKADRYPLSETPIDFIISADPDILKKTNVLDFYYEPGNLMITMTDKAKKMRGSLTMVFGGEDLQLNSWTITDQNGLQTSIHLSNIIVNERIPGGQFALHRF